MLLYKTFTTINNDDGGPVETVSWQGSQTESAKARKAAIAQGHKAATQTVNVPTAKGPLLEWLNDNVNL